MQQFRDPPKDSSANSLPMLAEQNEWTVVGALTTVVDHGLTLFISC